MTRMNHPQRLISILFLTLFCISSAIAQSVVDHIPIGRTPTSLAVNQSTNLVYAVSRQPRSMLVLNGAPNTIAADVSLNFDPEEIAVNSTTNRIYIAKSINGLFVVDGATNTVITNVSLPLGAVRVSVNSLTNRIYVGSSAPYGRPNEYRHFAHGFQITQAQATDLLTAANRIKRTLGCEG